MSKTNQTSLQMEATHQDALRMEDTLQTLEGVQPERTAPVEPTQQNKSKRPRMGRRKIPMQRIMNIEDRLITFSKRRAGIYKKATEISTLCAAEIGVLIFSPAGKPFAYGVPNIESIADRFLRGTNPSENENLSSIVMESRRREHVGKLNSDYDELSVYLQNLKKEGDELIEMKKKEFDDGCWWDIPVEELKEDEMEKVTLALEEIMKNASKRLRELNVDASSSSMAAIQPKVGQINKDGVFGYGGADGYCIFSEGGLSTMVEGAQGGLLPMGQNLGQGYKDKVGCGGRLSDWRDGSSTAVVMGIQGGGFRVDGNGALGGYGGNYAGLGEWGADRAETTSSFFQASALQVGGKGGDGYGEGVAGGFGEFMTGVSSMAMIHPGGVQISENGESSFGGGDVTSGGIGELRPKLSSTTSLAIQPASGSVQYGGNRSGGYGGGVASLGEFGGGWRAIVLSSTSSTILGANPMLVDGNGWFGNFGGNEGGGHGDWKEFRTLSMQMGGNGGIGYNGHVGASGGLRGASLSSSLQPNPMQLGRTGELVYGSIGGGGGDGGVGFGDFAMGGLSSSSLEPNQMQTGGNGSGGYINDDGVEFGDNGLRANNGFTGFFYDSSGGF